MPSFPRVSTQILLSLVVALPLGVASQPTAPPATAPTPTPSTPSAEAAESSVGPEVDLSWPILRFLLQAELLMRQGDGVRASDMFLELARRTRDPRLAKKAVQAALSAQDLTRANAAAQAWAALAPNEPGLKELQENLQIQSGEPDKIEPLLARRLQEARAKNQLNEAYVQIRQVLRRSANKKLALDVIERLSSADLNNLMARLVRADFAFAADDIERALRETAAARMIDPKNEQAVMTEVRYLSLDKKRSAEAIALLEKYVSSNTKSRDARFTLARLYANEGKTAQSLAQYKALEAENPKDPALMLSLAQASYQNKDRAQARAYLERYVELPEDPANDKGVGFLFLSDIAEEEKNLAQALQWAERVSTESQQYFNAQNRRVIVLGKLGRSADAQKALAELKPNNPAQKVRSIQTRASLEREAGRAQEVYKILMDAVQEQPEQTELLYDLGMAAEKINKLDIMEASLRKLIQLKPDSAHGYNALGYSFADRNIKLDEALQLIQKALSISPDDAHIVDSLGWVYFRKGDKPKALLYLRRAYAASPEPDVGAHLGEVLWSSGQRTEAIKLWREVKQRDPKNETLLETLKRLRVGNI